MAGVPVAGTGPQGETQGQGLAQERPGKAGGGSRRGLAGLLLFGLLAGGLLFGLFGLDCGDQLSPAWGLSDAGAAQDRGPVEASHHATSRANP